MNITINEALTLIKAIRNRIKDLESLRDKVSVTENYFSPKEKIIEPKYDVKAVDQKIVKLQEMLFDLDSSIKRENAINKFDTEVSKDKIFESLK